MIKDIFMQICLLLKTEGRKFQNLRCTVTSKQIVDMSFFISKSTSEKEI